MQDRQNQPDQTAGRENGEPLELAITGLAVGGKGLARAGDGRVILVDGALPGERVRATVVKRRRDFLEAITTDVRQPSAMRVAPACPVYDSCGGCDLMHLAYPDQVQAKAAWAAQALARLKPDLPIKVNPSPSPWAYRHRVRLQAVNGRLGFFRKKTRDLVEVAACPVACAAVNRLLPGLVGLFAASESAGLAWLEVLADDETTAFLTAGFTPGFRPGAGQMRRLQEMALSCGFAGLRSRRGPWPFSPESGVTYFRENELRLIAFPGLFCQVNFAVNRLLIQSVLAQAGAGQGRPALDLYAGSGNFSLPLARAGWPVLALEGAAGSVQAGEYLAGLNGLGRAVEFVQQEAGLALSRLASRGRKFDLAVLDPPRAGAKGLMPALAALKPERVIYVSCHPAALARDAADLGRLGYAPVSLEVFDMFPQTGQVEVMLVFSKI